MDSILAIAEQNQQRAREIINDTGIIECWQCVDATVNLIGSLKTGLLMKHRDIDFHIYTPIMKIADSFKAVAMLAENPRIKNITFTNLLDTEEECLEWHAWYRDTDNQLWQIDMIHIVKGSRYDGYFEKVTERISSVLTAETREAILKLKYETPDEEKIMGIEYYIAVIRDDIRTYTDFARWRKEIPQSDILEWMP